MDLPIDDKELEMIVWMSQYTYLAMVLKNFTKS